MRATPKMIAAAWSTWHARHGGKLGPGSAFVEAINAAISVGQIEGEQKTGEDEIDPLFYLLPPDQFDRVTSSHLCDIGPEFLGFTRIYRGLAAIIPKHWTVIDLGCAYAPQAFLFENHAAYIGVDFLCKERFSSRNTMHIDMPISEFCCRYAAGFDLNTTFAICSYVPPWGADNIEITRNYFKNVFTYYPSGSAKHMIADHGERIKNP